MSTPSDRIIIGENQIAGLPISAPVTTEENVDIHCPIRWCHNGTSFVLAYFCISTSKWIEVPCVIPTPTPAP
jgi:hypothetical protein